MITIRYERERETVALTRASPKVISSTKWEVNITKKYRVASSAMFFKMVGILSPLASDTAAKKIIDQNARKSDFLPRQYILIES